MIIKQVFDSWSWSFWFVQACDLNTRIYLLQDPNEDTEWNDVLRAKGIIPEKEKKDEITEDDIVNMLENTIEQKYVSDTLLIV